MTATSTVPTSTTATTAAASVAPPAPGSPDLAVVASSRRRTLATVLVAVVALAVVAAALLLRSTWTPTPDGAAAAPRVTDTAELAHGYGLGVRTATGELVAAEEQAAPSTRAQAPADVDTAHGTQGSLHDAAGHRLAV